MSDGPTGRPEIDEILTAFPDPETGRSAIALGQIRDVALDDGRLSLTLGLTTYSAPLWEETRADLKDQLTERCPNLAGIEIRIAEHARPAEKIGEIGLTAKSVIAVGSGKGGVGKSTIAATLAIGLQRCGAKVGLLDADVYGPSIPHLLGIEGQAEVIDERLQPIQANGLPVMSMGFLVPPGEAVIWRGPMLHGAITQFLRDTAWGDLDYLIIDMPPGTGDIALTLSQLLPLTGAIVVCTPQDVALLDAVKAITMFRKVNIDVLGLIENMSFFECTECHARHEVFGSGGAKQRANELEVPFLGDIPIHIALRVRGDDGRTAENFDDDAAASWLMAICQTLVRNIAAARKAQPPMPSLPVL
jgi:ATP-binding protein involved in chromosome partitioning